MENVRNKHREKPWSEFLKVVRYTMDKHTGTGNIGESLCVCSLKTLQKALNVASLSAMVDRLELLARENGLCSHLSATGTECYITSDLFYLEVQLKPSGEVQDVKVAHLGENPESCQVLLQSLRQKDFAEFTKHLKRLTDLYDFSGNRKVETNIYSALKSLEIDLNTMSVLNRRVRNAGTLCTILCGSVGYLTPRCGSSLMSLEYYISPYELLGQGLNSPSESRSPGMKVLVTVERTAALNQLQIAPIVDFEPVADGIPLFQSLTDGNSAELSACFLLKFPRPFPMICSLIQKIQRYTGISIQTDTQKAPLHGLIAQALLSERNITTNPWESMCFFVSLPGEEQHCYMLNKDSTKPGALVSKIPFSHPKQVPEILEVLRHQAACNTLISSFIRETVTVEDYSECLHFEIYSLSDTCISFTLKHPTDESLVCVVMDVVSSREIICQLMMKSSAACVCSDAHITRVIHRSMSIPVTMRSIYKKSQTQEAAVTEASREAPTSYISCKCFGSLLENHDN
eukprot:gi/632960621/ref/XP_007896300.1/ PREDICTED: mediator of RNA polymerase II transcription subunit 1-like [Callorhinchus milii]